MDPKKEFIYILTNPSFTGMVKIGRSKDVAKRLKTFETGVPTPFKCEYCCEVEDAQRVENAFKVIFRPYRIKGKEFYEILPYQAAEVLRLIGGKDQAERFNAEEEKQIPVQSKSPQFKFADMGIPIGATLSYVRDENINATVCEKNKVKYNDKLQSLSALTKELTGYIIRPTQYWEYEGENLLNIYNATYPSIG